MHPPRNLLESFVCDSVSEAPPAVGLYAWYGRIDAGEADWRFESSGGVDIGTGRFLDLLARHSTRYQPPPICLNGAGPFSTSLKGELIDETQAVLRHAVASFEGAAEAAAGGQSYDEKRASKVHEVVGAEAHRKALASILTAATPILTSPIYIGVATNLRQRLETHAGDIFLAAKFAREHADGRERLARKAGNFGARAVAAGFSPDSLVVWTLNLDSLLSDLSDTEKKRTLAEAAEWFLNRWHRPIFGRR